MKKFITFALACICVLTFAACSKDNADSPNEYVFQAKVLEISEQHLLVEPSGDSPEVKCSDKINVSVATVNCPEDLKVGDFVVIGYDGVIQELYPAIIPNVRSIQKK